MKLFISYSRRDKEWAYELWRNLKERNIHEPWIDKNLIAGTHWWDTILTKIETSDCFIFIMSHNSLASEYCLTECEYALALNKPILPLMIDDCLNAIPEEISQLHKIQLSIVDISTSIFEILLSIEESLTKIQSDMQSGQYEPNYVKRPFVADDIDDSYLIYQGALDDIERKNYQRAQRRLLSVVNRDDGVFSEMAKDIIEDFDFYTKRHEMYVSINMLTIREDNLKLAQQKWQKFINQYGTEYDPSELNIRLNNQDYQIAYYRILEAKASHKTHLDLSGLQIKQLPPEIFDLSDLTLLDLRSTLFTDFPDLSIHCQNLKQLDLTNTKITKMPLNICKLKSLQILSLAHCNLKNLPEEIGYLSNLTHLNISSNQIEYLPKEIGQLKNLNTLQLSENRLKNIPEEIGDLTNLELLQLSQNPLENLPKELSYCLQLKHLIIGNTELKNLPEHVFHLPNLQRVDLSHNGISNFNITTDKPIHIRNLNLSNNQLSELGKTIGKMSEITTLDLQNNNLKSLPIELGMLQRLTILYLNGNPLTDLPQDIVQKGEAKILHWLRDQVNHID